MRTSLAGLAAAFAVVALGQVADGDPASGLGTGLILTSLAWYVGRLVRSLANADRERAEYLEWKRSAEAARANPLAQSQSSLKSQVSGADEITVGVAVWRWAVLWRQALRARG